MSAKCLWFYHNLRRTVSSDYPKTIIQWKKKKFIGKIFQTYLPIQSIVVPPREPKRTEGISKPLQFIIVRRRCDRWWRRVQRRMWPIRWGDGERRRVRRRQRVTLARRRREWYSQLVPAIRTACHTWRPATQRHTYFQARICKEEIPLFKCIFYYGCGLMNYSYARVYG